MRIKSASYADKIRRIADDLSKMRISHEVDSTVAKLRIVANELERNLQKATEKKP